MIASKIVSKTGLILAVVLLLAVFAVANTALFVRILPYLLFLACPLMHFLMPGMHGGHGGHEAHGEHHEHGQDVNRTERPLLPAGGPHAHHIEPGAGGRPDRSSPKEGLQ